jgi:hypothetical protein
MFLAPASTTENWIHAPNCWTGHGSSQLDRVLDMLGMMGVGVKKGILFLGGNVTRDCGL